MRVVVFNGGALLCSPIVRRGDEGVMSDGVEQRNQIGAGNKTKVHSPHGNYGNR